MLCPLSETRFSGGKFSCVLNDFNNNCINTNIFPKKQEVGLSSFNKTNNINTNISSSHNLQSIKDILSKRNIKLSMNNELVHFISGQCKYIYCIWCIFI